MMTMKQYVLTTFCADNIPLDHCSIMQTELVPIEQLSGSMLPEITASEAAMLCSAIALLLGTAWIFKQLVRAMKLK